MRWIAVFALVLSGCGDPPPTTVSIHVVDATEAETAAIFAGSTVWESCLFEILPPGDDSGGVFVHVSVSVVLDGAAGRADIHTSSIWLNRAFSDYPDYFGAVGAHELGHVLLVSKAHLSPRVGLMSSPHHTPTLTDDDQALACREAGRCCKENL